MKPSAKMESGRAISDRPLAEDERSLIQANLRLSVAERLKRHDEALNTLKALRTAVRATHQR